jgi:hypothetical protein
MEESGNIEVLVRRKNVDNVGILQRKEYKQVIEGIG